MKLGIMQTGNLTFGTKVQDIHHLKKNILGRDDTTIKGQNSGTPFIKDIKGKSMSKVDKFSTSIEEEIKTGSKELKPWELIQLLKKV